LFISAKPNPAYKIKFFKIFLRRSLRLHRICGAKPRIYAENDWPEAYKMIMKWDGVLFHKDKKSGEK
jgi:hypothetical protein